MVFLGFHPRQTSSSLGLSGDMLSARVTIPVQIAARAGMHERCATNSKQSNRMKLQGYKNTNFENSGSRYELWFWEMRESVEKRCPCMAFRRFIHHIPFNSESYNHILYLSPFHSTSPFSISWTLPLLLSRSLSFHSLSPSPSTL